MVCFTVPSTRLCQSSRVAKSITVHLGYKTGQRCYLLFCFLAYFSVSSLPPEVFCTPVPSLAPLIFLSWLCCSACWILSSSTRYQTWICDSESASPYHWRALRAKSFQLCLTLQPHGLWPARLLCPWDGFSWQEYWSGLPCPLPGDLSDPGTEPVSHVSCIGSRFFTTSTTWEAPLPLDHQGIPNLLNFLVCGASDIP